MRSVAQCVIVKGRYGVGPDQRPLVRAFGEATRSPGDMLPGSRKIAARNDESVFVDYSASSTALATSAVPLLPPNSIGLMPSA